MQQDTEFNVRYLVAERAPIADVIASLQALETIMAELPAVLPKLVDGLGIETVDVRVLEVSEGSLREIVLVTLILSYQDKLKTEVVTGIHDATGYAVPHNLENLVTVTALIILFYGVGAIKQLVVGKDDDGPSKKLFDHLLSDLAVETGRPAVDIRRMLEERYAEKGSWKRLSLMTSRFFRPSKSQNNAVIEVNDRTIDNATVADVPAQFIVEHEAEIRPARSFPNATLELHAQDRDHQGQGWAAVVQGVTDKRVRLKLMEGVSPNRLWGETRVRGDVQVVYERVGSELIAREVHLFNVLGTGNDNPS